MRISVCSGQATCSLEKRVDVTLIGACDLAVAKVARRMGFQLDPQDVTEHNSAIHRSFT
jgi:hypothetical protein